MANALGESDIQEGMLGTNSEFAFLVFQRDRTEEEAARLRTVPVVQDDYWRDELPWIEHKKKEILGSLVRAGYRAVAATEYENDRRPFISGYCGVAREEWPEDLRKILDCTCAIIESDTAQRNIWRASRPYGENWMRVGFPREPSILDHTQNDILVHGYGWSELARRGDLASYAQIKYARAIQSAITPSATFRPKRVTWIKGHILDRMRIAYELIAGRTFWRPMVCERIKWFDGYDGQEVALFSRLDPGDIDPDMLFHLVDGYEVLVPTRTGTVVWRPKHVIVVSNYHPEAFRNELDAEFLARISSRIAEDNGCVEQKEPMEGGFESD